MPASRTVLRITDDELAVLHLLATGMTVEAAARQLETSPRTVRRRIKRLKDTLGVRTNAPVLAQAAREGLL